LRWRAYLRADACARALQYQEFDPSFAGDLLSVPQESDFEELPPTARTSARELAKAIAEMGRQQVPPIRLQWVMARLIWDLTAIDARPNVTRALVGRRVSDSLRSITFHHPTLGSTEAFLLIDLLPEGAKMSGASFDLIVNFDTNENLAMSVPAEPNAKPPPLDVIRSRLQRPPRPNDWNNVEEVEKYRAAVRKLISD
jgi:hypothetical protein